MKTVFSRVSTAIIAAVAVVASVLVVQPAYAVPSANPVSYSNYNLSKELVGSQANPSTDTPVNTMVVPAGVDEFNQYVTIQIGTDLAKSLAGHTIRVDWNKSFPAGVDFQSPSAPGLGRSLSFYGYGGFNFSGSDWTEMNTRIITDDLADPADSSLITVPASVANATGGQGISLSTSVQQYSGALAGTYSYAPTLYDKTTGAAITLSPTLDMSWNSTNTNAATASQVSWTQGGSGQFLGDVPAGGNMTQWAATCVSKSDMVVGNRLELTRTLNGAPSTAPMYGGANIYAKGTNGNYVGGFSPTYTIASTDTDSSATGFRISYSIPADNSSGSTPLTVSSSGLIVKDIDTSTEIQSSCAAETPSAPTFELTGRSSANVTWSKIDSDALNQWNQSNTEYQISLFKASDPTNAVYTGDLNNGNLSGSTYSQSIYFTTYSPSYSNYQVDPNTDYFVKISAKNRYDQVKSELSPASAISQLTGPSAPTNPTLTLNTLSNATITWSPSAGDSSGMNFGYRYEIFAESDLATPVRSGMLNAPLSNGAYSASVNFYNQMYMPDPLLANTNYVVKIKATNYSLSLDSVWSAASAADSISGPATPNKPVITSVTSSSLTATLAVRQGETTYNYNANVYSSTDSAFATILGSGNCSGSAPSYTCNVMPSMGGSFSSSVNYVVRIVASNNGIQSAPSPASDPMAGPLSGVTFSSAPSQSTADGKARTLTSSVPWITDQFNSMGMSSGRIFGDGYGNYYAANDAGVLLDGNSSPIGRKFTLRKFKADNTGFDTAFGTMTLNVPGSTSTMNNSLPGFVFFEGGNKVAAVSNSNGVTTLFEATLGSTFSAGVNVSQLARDYCTSNVDQAVGVVSSASVSLQNGYQALARPVATVYCYNNSSTNNTQRFAATLAADGTFTHLFKFHDVDSDQNSVTWSTSGNPNATGAQVATVVYALRTLSANGQTSNYDRAIFRVAANGTVTTTLNALPNATGSTPSISLAPYNDGITVHALANNAGLQSLTTIPVASGVVGSTISLSSMQVSMMSQLTFPASSVPAVNGELAFIKKNQTGPSTISYSPLRVNASTGAIIEGEVVTTNAPGSALFHTYIDAAGHMNAIYTPATQGVNTHSVLQWKNVRAMTNSVTPPSVNTPAYTAKDVLLSLNGGGTLMTITGTNLSSSLVRGVRFGTSSVLTAAKTATTLKLTVPTSTVAGVANVPTVDEPANVPVSIVLTDGTTVDAGVITYIGASKLTQVITTVTDTSAAFVGSPDRDLSVDNVTPILSLTPPVAPVLSPASVCIRVAGKVHFVGAGTCKISTSSPGTALLATGLDEKTITVVKQNQELSVSLDTEPAVVGEADRDISVTNTTSLTSGVSVTPVLTPSTVCTLVAGKVHFVGAGTCKVTSQAAASTTFNASAADVKSIVVTKQNQEIAVGLSTVAALVGEPDRNISISTATGLTPNNASITPVLSPSNVCTLVAGKVHFVGPGVCTVKTKANTSSMFNASVENVKKITVSKQTQELAVALSTATAFVGSPDRNITVINQTSLTPGAAVTPVLSPASVCTLVAGKVRFVGAGTCTIKSQARETSMFYASALSTKTIKVIKQNQVLSVNLSTATAFVGEPDRNVAISNTTTLTPGAAVTPILSPASVCTLVAGKVRFVGAGDCLVKSQALATPRFNASALSTKTIKVLKQNQRIVVTASTTPAIVGEADRDISITNTTSLTPGAAVTPVLSPSTVCTLVASKIHFVAPGICYIKSQAGATNRFNASIAVTKYIIVRKADNITVSPNLFVTDDSVDGFELPASTVSGRAISYTVSPASAAVCSYDSTLRVIKGKSTRTQAQGNTCAVTLSVAADSTWSAASALQTINISTASATGKATLTPLAVTNSNSAEGYKNMSFTWDRASGNLKLGVSSVFVGPITAKISWTSGGVAYSCSADFGTKAAVTGTAITAIKAVTSAGLCAGPSQATKLAALKTISNTTVVKVEISRQLFDPKTYKLVTKVSVAPVFLTLGN